MSKFITVVCIVPLPALSLSLCLFWVMVIYLIIMLAIHLPCSLVIVTGAHQTNDQLALILVLLSPADAKP